MLRNYLTTAVRSLRRHLGAGLATLGRPVFEHIAGIDFVLQQPRGTS